MQVERWRIEGAAFHFGRHGLGQEESRAYLPSDSLMAAMLARLAALQGPTAVTDLSHGLQLDPPPFVLSSAFPRAGAVCFFPAPLHRATAQLGEKPGEADAKTIKKVCFVSEAIFHRLIEGASLAALLPECVRWHDGQVLISTEEAATLPASVQKSKRIWKVEKRPRVTVGRDRHNSQIYFTGRTVFPNEGGLWFVLWLLDEQYRDLLKVLLDDLGLAGLGGERSSGFGQCRFVRQGDLELPDATDGYWLTLSRYLPQRDEMVALQAPQAAYAIEDVGGWVTSPQSQSQRRRAVRLLSEGSVLGPLDRPVPGQMVDVQPDYNGTQPLGHPVWRSGRALAVGITIAGPKGVQP